MDDFRELSYDLLAQFPTELRSFLDRDFEAKKTSFKVLKKLQNNDLKSTLTRWETDVEGRMRAP